MLLHKMVITDTLHDSKNVALVAFNGVKSDRFNDVNQVSLFLYVVKPGVLNDYKIVIVSMLSKKMYHWYYTVYIYSDSINLMMMCNSHQRHTIQILGL